MRILGIETAGPLGSVALVENGRVIAGASLVAGRGGFSRWLIPAIERMLSDAGWSPADLDRLAVNRGPGSFTGIRIGVASAEGLAFGWDKPLIGVHGLEALGWQAAATAGDGSDGGDGGDECDGENPTVQAPLVLSMIDARHGNVFAAAYRFQSGAGVRAIPVVEAATWPAEEFLAAVHQAASNPDQTAAHPRQTANRYGTTDAAVSDADVEDAHRFPIVLAGDGGVLCEPMAMEMWGSRVRPVPLDGERLRAETVARWAAMRGEDDADATPLYLRKPEAQRRWHKRA